MLLDNDYTLIPQLRFTLTYSNDVRKIVTVKTDDVVNCFYNANGTKMNIIGRVTKIGADFNSSLGVVGTSAYMQIDGSSEYTGQVVYVSPSQVINIDIVTTTGDINYPVTSIEDEDQRIVLVRENEAGVFQYSKNGMDWHAAVGDAGMSAYECAVKVGGFKGTEEEWLASLKGAQGPVGEPGSTRIDKIFKTVDEAEKFAINIEKGHVVALLATPSSLLYARNEEPASINGGTSGIMCVDGKSIPDITGYDYLGEIALSGESAYQTAVRLGFEGSEEEWLESLKGADGESAYMSAVAQGFVGTVDDWLASLKGETGEPGANGKSAYEYAQEGGYNGTEDEFAKVLGHPINVDEELSNTSTNPVQNKVISTKVDDLQKQINAITAGSGQNPVVVADTYFGEEADLKHAVYGPIRLVVYGKTTPGTMESIAVSTIHIYDNDENEQTLQFQDPITLRSVPNVVGSCPNVEIDGVPAVADFICEKGGVVGVTRRIVHVDNYAGECVIGDFLSSTGDLDLGAEVQYVTYGTFEPLPDDVQEQWKTFHSYDGEFHVRTMEATNVSVTYPIDVVTYIDEAILNKVEGDYSSYIDTAVEEAVTNKVGDIGESANVSEYVKDTVTDTVGNLGEDPDVVTYVTNQVNNAKTEINQTVQEVDDKIGELPANVTSISEFIGTLPESTTNLTEMINSLVEAKLEQLVGEFGDMSIKEYIDQKHQEAMDTIGPLPGEFVSAVDYIGDIPDGSTVADYMISLVDAEVFTDSSSDEEETQANTNSLAGKAKVVGRRAAKTF